MPAFNPLPGQFYPFNWAAVNVVTTHSYGVTGRLWQNSSSTASNSAKGKQEVFLTRSDLGDYCNAPIVNVKGQCEFIQVYQCVPYVIAQGSISMRFLAAHNDRVPQQFVTEMSNAMNAMGTTIRSTGTLLVN